ncbi:Ankyrin repeat-containing protein [Acorus gramineus]|uniref:Ankyrin repeat-containing protein n=1 Tax=Acorus gramineus TaxID=55184 RepID=A0AAV9BTQ5_ACOGR|nr:Ankyrin repeat-containing protein [Acorus gramineus]
MKMTVADEQFKSSAESYTLVAALFATITFSAIFTMLGGYSNNDGTALRARDAAFKVFLVSNIIATCSSLVVVFCFIWAWKDPVKFKLSQLAWGHRLTVVACLAKLVSLMTVIYVVVAEKCLWLAVTVILICCAPPCRGSKRPGWIQP